MKVLFRSDASSEIGSGHVMRCLTLARALRERGADCRFLCREHQGNLLARIRTEGFEAIGLRATYRPNQRHVCDVSPLAHVAWLGTDWQTDLEQTIAGVDVGLVDWLIVDHYALDVQWESAMRPYCKRIMVIDDLADRDHDCDLLLDQNLVTNLAHRYDNRLPTTCGRMLGTNYALLQPQYAELHARIPVREGPIKRILVSFGGADNENLTGRTIAAFLSLERPDVVLDVVINPVSTHAERVREQTITHANIVLHEYLPSLAPLIAKADMAIGAAGVTAWERCCLGLPSIVISLAENQKPIAAEMDMQGLIQWLGHKDDVSQEDIEHALMEVLRGSLSPEWSERCWKQVDGQGTSRVVSILMFNAKTRLKARPVTLDDMDMILRWANDPMVRRNGFSNAEIDHTTHRAWFHKRLRELDDCIFFIVETEDGLPVGQVRFERVIGGAWEIHYSMDACLRGRGCSAPFLQSALSAFRSAKPHFLLFGRVKPENIASRKTFIRLGFTDVITDGELSYQLQCQ